MIHVRLVRRPQGQIMASDNLNLMGFNSLYFCVCGQAILLLSTLMNLTFSASVLSGI